MGGGEKRVDMSERSTGMVGRKRGTVGLNPRSVIPKGWHAQPTISHSM